MRNRNLILVIFFPLLILSPDLDAGEFYQWVSQDGVIHYSDRQPKTRDIPKIEIKDIPTIKTVKAKPIIKIRTQKNTKRKKPSANRCTLTKQKIVKLEKKLSLKNKAASFDYLNKQLSELRWIKLKHC